MSRSADEPRPVDDAASRRSPMRDGRAHPDLFARVDRSVDARPPAPAVPRSRRGLTTFALLLASTRPSALALTDSKTGGSPWNGGSSKLITNIVLVAIAIGLGPFIKRFGRATPPTCSASNPRTGKSYLVLTDVAYYLIFTSFILFTVKFDPPVDWERRSTARAAPARVGARRRDPAHHGHPPRRQPADPADHRPPADAEPAARPADARGRRP